MVADSPFHTIVIKHFLFAKKAPKISLKVYSSEYSMNTLCKYEEKSRWVFYLFALLENTCFLCNSMGNGPVDGATTSILKH